ncbi:hypothetical protein [Sulfurovum sp. NBC37-1]|uniref:hypothetical protein n=1 Tax=Sulfurovum sp. (strain NBC37-1) TaxID=387093 RepID=UPI00015878CD|nr:hypothetical protein [Sulfurovum sp. NBC37-1]BAF72022.1 conserved hypothetical protein [Sulfurovum sp. NBC37-1]
MLKFLFAFLLLSVAVSADDLLVVTNASNDINTVTPFQLRQVYLGKRRFWKEMKLLPLNLPPQNKLRKKFEKNVLHMSPSALDAYWMKEHYLGHRPPYRVESVESMIRFVKKVKGAIGYIPERKAVKGIKVIYRIKE